MLVGSDVDLALSALAQIFHEFTPWRDCDYGYGLPSWLPRVSAPATYRSGTETNPAVPRDELPVGTPIFFALAALRSVPQAGSQFRGLATAIHKISWLVDFQGIKH